MESYKCKFCFKTFVNGRALGGHMRSHMPSLHKFSIQEEEERPSQLSIESKSNVSSSSEEIEEISGLREEKHRTMDDGSETESSRNIVNLTRKRSKRTRKLDSFSSKKMIKTSQLGYEPEAEAPHSSASDTTTEEDLAFCLMMLSRDKWKKNKVSSHKEVVEAIDVEASEGYKIHTTKGRYTCETCGKVFKSYQALGGHRASHKKNRVSNKTEYDAVVVAAPEKRIHECPICLRVFASGQALGGHKRSHGLGNLSVNHQVDRTEPVKQRILDLNLPAPTEEDEVSVVFQ
ncbi:Zinc finger protein ZAT9 [Raphanus sativus]|uniref:Zinc finger protein ZAT9 n=1 Tax=Raphanus sativus TaxID=3726 RepID=A0A6J0NXJ7_RAPSA|nr:zinc finger protein ZAT9 [Raphanus sativus]KAJ4896278.1 Zinc finger protein ZAT9 [Raphanus sativus]